MFGALRSTLSRWWHASVRRKAAARTLVGQGESLPAPLLAPNPAAIAETVPVAAGPAEHAHDAGEQPVAAATASVAEGRPRHASSASDDPAATGVSTPPPASPDERNDTEQSLIEVLGVDALPAPALHVPVDPRVREHTLSALNGLRQIPALQSLAQGFMRALGRPEISVGEVVASIEKDSALCVRILRMANSVLVSPERPIEDLESAVQMLGVARVRKAAQALFTLRDANRVADGFDWRHLWIHALATAAIADELEQQLRSNADSQVYLAGLLHDVGKIVLSTIAADAYREVLVVAWNENGRLEDLERQRLGVDHREAGVMFAEHNGLPPVVVQAIAHHERPQDATEFRLEVALVAIANYVSKAHGLGFSGARLDDDDGEFGELPAWDVVEEACGFRPNADAVEEELAGFIATLRIDLRSLRTEV
ncbi:MAG TPA: HDOD domain-containing protein [Opitutaceae bacterium]|nr:HDOD domain-containing protein [Opitutaceae bacterium]